MNWNLSAEERIYLRALAQKQASYAALPIMAERKALWYALNDAHPSARPPVVIETWTFDRDFLPNSVFRCTTPTGRQIESQLLRNIRNHELIDDDKVIPNTFDTGWSISEDEFGVAIERQEIPDAGGVVTGYRFQHPIRDLVRDLPRLKPATFQVDRAQTHACQDFLSELLGEYLPVVVRTGCHISSMLTNRVIELMGMQAFFTAMIDQPQAVHQLMAYLQDNALRRMNWLESEGLLTLNNGNQDSFGSSYSFTTRLPQPDYHDGPLRLVDTWGCSNSQETVGISPRMFREFCLPYYQAVCQPMGLLYYGCCEPVHKFWESIRQLPHLKKVSISPWCDQPFMGEALQGSQIVFSRKPDPNFLSVEKRLDEDAWAAHIRETLAATRGVYTEFILRDVYTVHGDLRNARRAVEIARREIERHYRP